MENLIYFLLRKSGLCFLSRKLLWRNRAAILFYHNPRPVVLDAHLSYLKQIATVVSLPELWNHFSHEPLAVVTIDDGEAEVFQLRETFEKHGIRPMIYLPTGIIRIGGGFWWHVFASGQQKLIESLKRVKNPERKKILRDFGFDQEGRVVPRQALEPNELRAMRDWADFGAHSRFHPILTQCSDDECEEEIFASKNELKPQVGYEFEHFAYPNGNYTDREIGYVREAGFQSARTCDPGWNSPKTNRLRLKGLYIDDDASLDKFAVELTGIPAILRRILKRPYNLIRSALGSLRQVDAAQISGAGAGKLLKQRSQEQSGSPLGPP